MPIDLNPALLAFNHSIEKGALVRIDPANTTEFAGDMLYFQYNRETMTRTRTGQWEPRQQQRRATTAPPQDVRGERGGQGSAALRAESETIAMKISFDATEAILAGRAYPNGGSAAALGILPQLAFLEVVALGKESQDTRSQSRRDSARPIRSDELLLVLGRQRMFPVVLTSLTITEQKFSPTLVPIRAEVDLKMNVLEPVESAYSRWIKSAFDQLLKNRQDRMGEAAASGAVPDVIARALRPPAGPAV